MAHYNSVIEFQKIDHQDLNYYEYFTQDVMEQSMEFDHQHEIIDILKLELKVKASIEKYIQLPVGCNDEGIEITGLAARVHHVFQGRLEYTTENSNMKVLHFQIPVINQIYLPYTFNCYKKYETTAVINKVFFTKQAKNSFYLSCIYFTGINI